MSESTEQPFLAVVRSAIGHYGSQATLAATIGCSQQYISWLLHTPGANMSAEMALKLHNASGGLFAKHLTRPDLFESPTPLKEAV